MTQLSHTHGCLHADADALPRLLHALETINSQAEYILQPHEGSALPTACIDGRPEDVDEEVVAGSLRPDLRLAGATLSPWIGTILGASTSCQPSFPDTQTAVTDLAHFCASLHARELPVATHCDDHAPHDHCGCGAADALGAVLDVLSRESDYIQELLTSWGFDADLSDCSQQAQTLAPVLTGAGLALHQTISQHSDRKPARLLGPHREVAVIVNLRPATVVRREIVEEILTSEGLPEAQVFTVDLWACHALVTELGLPPQAIIACAAFNVAALLTLCGSHTRLVVFG